MPHQGNPESERMLRYSVLPMQCLKNEHPVEECLHTAQCVRIRVRIGWEAPAVAREAAAG